MKRQTYHRPATTTDLREDGRIILAKGEATGHHHEVVSGESICNQAQFFEEPSGRRVLLAVEPCTLTHQEHGAIALDPREAARGASGERDASGKLRGQYRQGDVCLHPIGLGAWEVRRQREYAPEAIRAVAD